MHIFVKKSYIITIGVGKWLYELRTLRGIVFNLAFIACCASITGCTTSYVMLQLEDVHVTNIVHSVQSASIVGGDLNVCVSASNILEKEPINYTLNIPYQKVPLWIKQEKKPLLRKVSIGQWTDSLTSIVYQPCEASLTGKPVKILNIVQLTYVHDKNYLSWYLNESGESTVTSNKESANNPKYSSQALMLDAIVKSGVLENKTVFTLSDIRVGGDQSLNSYMELYYFDPVLKFPNTSYFELFSPSKLVEGNKMLIMLLPATFLLDMITLPVQMYLFSAK